MENTPRSVLRTCERLSLLRAACPRQLPYVDGVTYGISVGQGARYETLSLEVGVPYGAPPFSQLRRNGPPGVVHIVIQSGGLREAFGGFHFDRAVRSRPVRPRDGLLIRLVRRSETQRRELKGIYFGRVRWGTHLGQLVLADSADSIDADHLIFRWREGGVPHALSLHAWEPLLQTVATLRAIVVSVPPRPEGR